MNKVYKSVIGSVLIIIDQHIDIILKCQQK